MSEIVRVVFVRKLACPREREERSNVAVLVLGANVIPVVFDIGAVASPSDALLAGVLLTVHQRPHAKIVQALRLEKVANREAVLHVRFGFLDLKIEPLCVFVRVQVVA